jgi:hypothetical protein
MRYRFERVMNKRYFNYRIEHNMGLEQIYFLVEKMYEKIGFYLTNLLKKENYIDIKIVMLFFLS